MTLDDGATFEILSRWPEFRQRNVALDREVYGIEYADHMLAGIHLIRSHHAQLKAAGATEWTMPTDLENLLDELAGTPTVQKVIAPN